MIEMCRLKNVIFIQTNPVKHLFFLIKIYLLKFCKDDQELLLIWVGLYDIFFSNTVKIYHGLYSFSILLTMALFFFKYYINSIFEPSGYDFILSSF